jgi:hypothetical protein
MTSAAVLCMHDAFIKMFRLYKGAENRFSYVSNELVQETLAKLSQFRRYEGAGTDVETKIALGTVVLHAAESCIPACAGYRLS